MHTLPITHPLNPISPFYIGRQHYYGGGNSGSLDVSLNTTQTLLVFGLSMLISVIIVSFMSRDKSGNWSFAPLLTAIIFITLSFVGVIIVAELPKSQPNTEKSIIIKPKTDTVINGSKLKVLRINKMWKLLHNEKGQCLIYYFDVFPLYIHWDGSRYGTVIDKKDATVFASDTLAYIAGQSYLDRLHATDRHEFK